MAIKQAANKPAPSDHNSFVRKYVAIDVNPLNRKTDVNDVYIIKPDNLKPKMEEPGASHF